MSPTRRQFLAGLASAALVGCSRKAGRIVEGGFVDDAGARGHRVRDRADAGPPRRTVRTGVAVVGAGIAGLSAAWRMDKRGFGDFVVLELEDVPGGNARWGENERSAYPWAAHYLPVPGPRATLVRELMEELGVLRDGAWDPQALVHDPEERLYRWGAWRHDLVGTLADSRAEQAEFHRFHERLAELRATGEFTIPSALAAPEDSPLDRISFADWLRDEGFSEPSLLWYADYACRDDYGAMASATSAWAGIHYFAARPAREEGPLTWPEGNGWIARRLLEPLDGHVRTGAPVHRIEPRGRGLRIFAGDTEYHCDAAIWAAPSFVAPHVIDDADAPGAELEYSPWLTANLTLDRIPQGRGAEPAWDNVVYGSPSLGYVVANHQDLRTHREREVWTWYHALADRSPAEARALLLARPWEDWRDFILSDLERAHPDIRACVTRIDVLRMGHAMVRPVPGFLSSPGRRALREADGPVFYAHSDLSGLSLFEEAQQRGVAAADRALARLGST